MFIRKKNRLPNKKIYQSHHRYFVTICVQDRQCIFGDIVESDTVGQNDVVAGLQVNDLGSMVVSVWKELVQMFGNVVLDQFVVMPNHIHGIVGFEGVPFSHFTQKDTDLGKIVKRFKIESLSRAKQLGYENILQRQKSFYDHVIRNQKDLERIQEYIFNNPLQREQDILNIKNDLEYQKKYKNRSS